MNLRERIKANREITQRARKAAEEGKTFEEFQEAELSAADENGASSVWLELIMALLPLLLALFQKK